MRRILLSVLVLGAAAACGEPPTAPGPTDSTLSGPDLARAGDASITPIPFVLGPVRSLGTTTTGEVFRAPNNPRADLGGDLVVWQYRGDPYWYFGSIDQIQVSTGARTKLADFQSGGDPHISPDGRYSAWIDQTGIVLLDNTTGARRQVPATKPYSWTLVIAGGKLLFVDEVTPITYALVLYDIVSGTSRTLVETGAGKEYPAIGSDAFDGRYAVYVVSSRDYPGHAILAYDTRTDATLQVMPFGKGYITTGIWADGGRVVYARDVPGGYSVFVSDIATGATRVIDTAPVRAANPRISGNLVTWDDTRNDHSGSPYVLDHDVFLYDLSAKVLMPVASTPTWESDARVNGNRVMWIAWNNNAWELLLRDVTPVTLPVLQAEVKSMAAAGAIHNAGIARNLDALLANAAAMQRRSRTQAILRVRQFVAQVAQQSGKQIEPAAAQRLQGMALAVISRM